jgi:hypothetical protein
MNKNRKTYKWGNHEIELGKVYTLKDFPPFGPSSNDEPDGENEEE